MMAFPRLRELDWGEAGDSNPRKEGQFMAIVDRRTVVGMDRKSPRGDIVGRAQAAMLECPILAIRGVTVEQLADRLVIRGRVSSFYHKQQAQEVVRAVSEGMLVVNDVVVQPSHP